jgi:hypothetical protein
LFAVLCIASSASAIIISGGPTQAPPGGGGCVVPNSPDPDPRGSGPNISNGLTLTCSNLNLNLAAGGVRHLYYGIDNSSVNGNSLRSDSETSKTPVGGEIFRFKSKGDNNNNNNIRYSASTRGFTADLNLTFPPDTGSLISVGTALDNANNGDVKYLWEVTKSSFAPNATLFAPDDFIFFFPYFNQVAFNPSKASALGSDPSVALPAYKDYTHVQLAFYYDACGNGKKEGGELCDDGPLNGTTSSCCTTDCAFRAEGSACGPPACYQDGQCTGLNDVCQGINVTPGCSGCTGHADGSPCDDTNACTQGDACLGGACVGHPVVCQALDQCHAVGQCSPLTGQCSNPPQPTGTSCTAPNGKPSTCDGQGSCLPPGICGNHLVEPPAEQCEPDQGECCVPAGQPGECTFRGPTEQCGNETRICHTAFQCTGRDAACPTGQPNNAPEGMVCLDAADPDCILSQCHGGDCQSVSRICMADASAPRKRTARPTVTVRCFSDQPGPCTARLTLDPAANAAGAANAVGAGLPKRVSNCPGLPATDTDLTGSTHVKSTKLKPAKAPDGLTRMTVVRLRLNRLGQRLLQCQDLNVTAQVTLTRSGQQLHPLTSLLKLLGASR